MNFLKNLFGGGGGGNRQGGDSGLYFYVRPRGCEEVVEVRINPANELSIREEGGYFVQKTVRGTHRCFNPAEMTLYFDRNRSLTSHEVSGGEMVERDAYDAWEATLAARRAAIREQNAAVDAANAEDNTDDTEAND